MRAFLLYAYLQAPSGVPRWSPAFFALDPSEKSGVSYTVGMACAKLFSRHLFGVEWLMHIDRYGRRFGLSLSGQKRPDLFGTDIVGGWIVVEAKGRSNGMEPGLAAALAGQKSSVSSIAGQAPTLRVGTVAHFYGNKLSVFLCDPPLARNGDEVPLDRSSFIETYYEPIADLVEEQGYEEEVAPGDRARLIRFESVDAEVGIEVDVLTTLRAEAAVNLGSRMTRREPRRAATRDQRETYIGSDGVVVRLGPSWSPEEMRRGPEERRGSPL
jgi:hypothetical protein